MPILASLAAVAAVSDPAAADLSWMSGHWLSCEGGREVAEVWSEPRGDMMIGHGVTFAGGRTTFEYMRLAPHDGVLSYVAQPGGQPPTPFQVTETTATSATFSNPANDFPQRVVYRLDGDRLTARIEGEMNGRTQAMEWRFRRTPMNERCPA